MHTENRLNPQELQEYFDYNPDTGELRRKWSKKLASIQKTDKGPALYIYESRYNARSVVWAIMHGYFPVQREIRCVDGDLYNLRASNFHRTPDGFQVCPTCKTEKPLSEFSVDKYRKHRQASYYCKPCVKERVRDANIKHGRRTTLRKYGITPDQYKAMSEAQNHKCAICQKPETTKHLAVDHCHKTGKVRGLLCQVCNTSIGKFRDSIELLTSAIAYLNAHPT